MEKHVEARRRFWRHGMILLLCVSALLAMSPIALAQEVEPSWQPDQSGDVDLQWPAPASPSISIAKQVSVEGAAGPWLDADSSPFPEATVGDPVYYRFVVTNTGNRALGTISISDPDINTSSCSPPFLLGTGDSFNCSFGPIIALQGQQQNTASVSAKYLGTTVQDSDSATYTGVVSVLPGVSLQKQVSVTGLLGPWVDADSSPGPLTVAGLPVFYRFVVTNVGGTPLTGIQISDPDCSLLLCIPPLTLASQDTFSCTSSVVIAQEGVVQNTGTVTAMGGAAQVQDTDSAFYTGERPEIQLEKQVSVQGALGPWLDADTAPGPSITAGMPVYYRFVVTNIGTTTLQDVSLNDPGIELSLNLIPGVLPPGWNGTAWSKAVTAIEGQQVNTATVTSLYGPLPVTDTNVAYYSGDEAPEPAIEMEKQVSISGALGPWYDADEAPGPATLSGLPIRYRFVITNTGNTALTDVTINDPDVEMGLCIIPPNLLPDATVQCFSEAVIAQAGLVSNVATVTATCVDQTVQDSDGAYYFGARPRIDIEKYVGPTDAGPWADADEAGNPWMVSVGDDVYYRITVSNTGNVPLDQITFGDPGHDTTSCVVSTTLAPDEWFECVIGPEPAQELLNTNLATVTGYHGLLPIVDADLARYFGLGTPAIDLVKYVGTSATGPWYDANTLATALPISLNEDVYYKLAVTNGGDVTLDDVAVSDDHYDTTGCVISQTLAPGESTSCVLGPIAPSLGLRSNTATATATHDDAPVEDTDVAIYLGQPLPILGSIGDTVWCDHDYDGQFDPGEGLVGVRVSLYRDTCCDGQPDCREFVRSQLTVGDGQYLFPSLSLGCYVIEVDASDPQLGTCVDPITPISHTVELCPGKATDLDADFGLEQRGSVGDTVWCDADYDGLYDAGEGMAGITVSLYADQDCNSVADSAVPVSTTVTAGDGQYLFDELELGCYLVAVDKGDTDLGNCDTPITETTMPVTLTAAAPDDLTIDFGFEQLGSIGDIVWCDTDLDKLYDVGEGIAGIMVRLFADADGNSVADSAVPISTTVTAGDGRYLFDELHLGHYVVEVDATDTDLDACTAPITLMAYSLLIDSRSPDFDRADFGFEPVGDISGWAWYEAIPNNTHDSGEPGFPGVTVELYGGGGAGTGATLANGGGPLATTQTDGAGAYRFEDLRPETYHLVFVAPTGYAFALNDQGDDALDSDADPITGQTAEVTLSPANLDATLDAGLYIVLKSGIPELEMEKYRWHGTCQGWRQRYTIRISNVSEQPFSGLRVVDHLPPANIVSVLLDQSSDGAIHDREANTVTWDIGMLMPGQTVERYLEIRVWGSAPAGSELENCAMLWGQGPIPLWNDCDVSVVENCDPPAPPPAVTMTPTPTVTPTPTEQPLPPQIDMLYLPIIDFRN